jgi:membrane protein implicated in regulation of membrane protease activity
MFEILENLNALQSVFFIIAASSTLILLIQTIFAAIGFGDSETDSDTGGDGGGSFEAADGDVDIDADADIDSDSNIIEQGQTNPVRDDGFRVFTIKGIMAFLMMGGWVGFLLLISPGVHLVLAMAFALISGVAALLFMAKLMQKLMALQSDGTLKIKNALGQIGQVYIRIPAEEKGMGKVNVTVQERYCEFDAVTEQNEIIKTGEMVYVTDIRAGNVLVVEKVKVEELGEEN